VACVIKPDIGAGGVGQLIVRAGEYADQSSLLQRLLSAPYLAQGTAVVEQWIDSPGELSPSLEFYVPPMGAGEPTSLYLCEQIFQSSGHFMGVMIDRTSAAAPWYPAMAADGLQIARQLQKLGYVGFFDLDAIVDADGRLYLLEVNPRRTGGTHAHEFARQQFGDDYLQQVTVHVLNQLSSGPIATWPQLRSALGDLLYPQGRKRRGVVVTITSLLACGKFGCLIVAGSRAEALALCAEVDRRIRLAGASIAAGHDKRGDAE
jgi:hypothetical protein